MFAERGLTQTLIRNNLLTLLAFDLEKLRKTLDVHTLGVNGSPAFFSAP